MSWGRSSSSRAPARAGPSHPQEQQELVRLCAKGNRELLKLQREILKR